MRYQDFERTVLALAFETDIRLTPPSVAYHLDLPIAEVNEHLETLLHTGAVVLESDADGNLYYDMPNRPQESKRARPQTQLEQTRHQRRVRRRLGLLVPGLGATLSGRPLLGLAQMTLTISALLILVMFWKDFGDSEHKPWMWLNFAVLAGTWCWAFFSIPGDDIPD